MNVSGRYAYVAVGTALVIVDVSNPSSPFVAGSLTGAATAVAAVGTRVYTIVGSQLQILDASNPAAPVLLGTTSSRNAQYIAAAGTQVYLASPSGSHYDPNAGVHILDASVPTNVVAVTQIIVPGTVRGLTVNTGFLHASDSAALLDVIDLAP
ncbi:MAG: hypothetical protein DMD81_01615 [Candidatus Rokuibacteriota bacterium]|nr:MAG: hypothetical protein DMD81_01615 [Candidatus Rokubacteria bacterium]